MPELSHLAIDDQLAALSLDLALVLPVGRVVLNIKLIRAQQDKVEKRSF